MRSGLIINYERARNAVAKLAQYLRTSIAAILAITRRRRKLIANGSAFLPDCIELGILKSYRKEVIPVPCATGTVNKIFNRFRNFISCHLHVISGR